MKKERVKILLAGVVIAAAVSIGIGICNYHGKKQTKESEDLRSIKVGYDKYPPFSYMDTDAKPAGIDMDLAEEAFHRIGYKPKFQKIDWENKKELLEDGTIDCVWSSFTMDGREDEYQWAGPYMKSHQVIAVMKDSKIQKLSDLKDKTIAVQTTTKPEEIFLNADKNGIPRSGKLLSMQNRELIFSMLSKGYVDAIAAHETSVRQYMKDYHTDYRTLEEPLVSVGLGVAFSLEKDHTIVQELSKSLKSMYKDGTTKKIIGKYLDEPERYLEGIAYE